MTIAATTGDVAIPNGDLAVIAGDVTIGGVAVVPAGVTLAGTPDYITISGQVITRAAINLTTDVTGDLPVADGGTGSSTAAGARTNLGVNNWTQHSTLHTGISSGSTLSWTSIPSGVTNIKIVFNDYSSSATQELAVQLGDSGGFETSGYSGRTAATSGGDAWSSEAVITQNYTASTVGNGTIQIVNNNSNEWSINTTSVPEATGSLAMGAGGKTLSGTLTQVRLLMTAAGTFDLGDYTLYYQ